MLVNFAYVFVLGVEGVQNTDSVAVDVAERLFGTGGHLFVTLLVLVSTLGSIMGMIISSSRIFFAMGRDRLFFDAVGRVNRRGTPAVALAGVGIIAAVYTLVGSFEQIIGYFVFISMIWLALNVISVIRQRILHPDFKRPFRVPLYPIPPLIFLTVTFGLMFQLFRENTRNVLIGIGVVLASIPAFLIWERFRTTRDSR